MAKFGTQELVTLGADIEKQFDTAWAEGDVAGGGAVTIPSGSGIGDYYYFLITKDADGTVDAMGDTSATGANVPSGWTVRRRLGAEPYHNTGGVCHLALGGYGRSQIGNVVLPESRHSTASVVNDSSFTANTAETFNFNDYVPDNYRISILSRVRLTSTRTSGVTYMHTAYDDVGVSTSSEIQTPVVASGDSATIIFYKTWELGANEDLTYESATTSTGDRTLVVSYLGYYDHRELN